MSGTIRHDVEMGQLARKQALDLGLFTPRGSTSKATWSHKPKTQEVSGQVQPRQTVACKVVVQVPQLPSSAECKDLPASHRQEPTQAAVPRHQKHPLPGPVTSLDLSQCVRNLASNELVPQPAGIPAADSQGTARTCGAAQANLAPPLGSPRRSLASLVTTLWARDPFAGRTLETHNSDHAGELAKLSPANPYKARYSTKPSLEALTQRTLDTQRGQTVTGTTLSGHLASGLLAVRTPQPLSTVPVQQEQLGTPTAASLPASEQEPAPSLPYFLRDKSTDRRQAQLLLLWLTQQLSQCNQYSQPVSDIPWEEADNSVLHAAASQSVHTSAVGPIPDSAPDSAAAKKLPCLLPELANTMAGVLAYAGACRPAAGRLLAVLARGMSALTQQLAAVCLEHGCLAAFLWNTACGILEQECNALSHEKQALLEAQAGAKKGVKRMQNTLDWIVETRTESKQLKVENEHLQSRLQLMEGLCNDLQRSNMQQEEQAAAHALAKEAEHRKAYWELAQKLIKKGNALSALKADRDQLAQSVSEAAAVVEEAAGGLVQLGRMLLVLLGLPEYTVFSDIADGQPEKAVVMLVQQLAGLMESLTSRCNRAEDEHLRLDEAYVRLEAEEEGFRAPQVMSVSALLEGRPPGASQLSSLLTAWKARSGVTGLIDCLRQAATASADIQAPEDVDAEAAGMGADPGSGHAIAGLKLAHTTSGQRRGAVSVVIKVEEPVYLTLQLASSAAPDSATDARLRELEAKCLQLQATVAAQEAALQKERQASKELQRTVLEQAQLVKQHSCRLSGGDPPEGPNTSGAVAEKALLAAAHTTSESAHASHPGILSTGPAATNTVKPRHFHTVKMIESAEDVDSGDVEGRGYGERRPVLRAGTLHGVVSQVAGKLMSKELDVDLSRRMGARDVRLREAVIRYSDVKPRSMEWLLKLVENLYKTKALKDEQCDKAGMERCSLPDHMFTFLLATYGAKSLVNEYASCIMITLAKYASQDLRLRVFQYFIKEDWDTAVLSLFLTAMQHLAAPSRVPCVEFPADYSLRRGASNLVCVHKCIAVADRMLGERSVATSRSFAASLVKRSLPTDEEEEELYKVSPEGLDTRDAAAAGTAVHVTHGRYQKITSIMFLNELCREYVRCEAQFIEILPSLIQVHDSDLNGMMEKAELQALLTKLTGSEELGHDEADVVWRDTVGIELSILSQQLGHAQSGWTAANGRPMMPSQVGLRAAVEALRKSEAVRRFVRLHHTSPAADVQQNNTEEFDRLVAKLLARNWRDHGTALSLLISQAGRQAPFIQEQVSKMKAESHPGRQLALYCNVVEGLVTSRLTALKQRCAPVTLEFSDAYDVEDFLESTAIAVKVLFGCPCALVESALPTKQSGIGTGRKATARMVLWNRLRKQVEATAASIIWTTYRRHRKAYHGGGVAE